MPIKEKQTKLLNTHQAASYPEQAGFPVKPKSLEVWRCLGRGPCFVKIGRRVFYRQEQLDAFLSGVQVKVIDPRTGLIAEVGL